MLFLKYILLYSIGFLLGFNNLARLRYLVRFHRIPCVESPTSFNEFILKLKLFPRLNPTFGLGDKLKSKKYVSSLSPNLILPTLAVISSFADCLRLTADVPLIVKSNSASGIVRIFPKGIGSFKHKVILCWMFFVNYIVDLSLLYLESSYKDAAKCLIVEPLLTDNHLLAFNEKQLSVPVDIKVFVFRGKPKIFQVDFDRFNGHSRNFYSTDGTQLPIRLSYPSNDTSSIVSTSLIDKIHTYTDLLASHFYFVRLDFLFHNNHLYFTEYTYYPGSGLEKFDQILQDQIFLHHLID